MNGKSVLVMVALTYSLSSWSKKHFCIESNRFVSALLTPAPHLFSNWKQYRKEDINERNVQPSSYRTYQKLEWTIPVDLLRLNTIVFRKLWWQIIWRVPGFYTFARYCFLAASLMTSATTSTSTTIAVPTTNHNGHNARNIFTHPKKQFPVHNWANERMTKRPNNNNVNDEWSCGLLSRQWICAQN